MVWGSNSGVWRGYQQRSRVVLLQHSRGGISSGQEQVVFLVTSIVLLYLPTATWAPRAGLVGGGDDGVKIKNVQISRSGKNRLLGTMWPMGDMSCRFNPSRRCPAYLDIMQMAAINFNLNSKSPIANPTSAQTAVVVAPQFAAKWLMLLIPFNSRNAQAKSET
jgi:hypothetical protein